MSGKSIYGGNEVIRALFLLYIFFVSWTGVLALGSWLRLPFIFAIAGCTLIAVSRLRAEKFAMSSYFGEDFLVVLFIASWMMSAVVNMNEASLNYVAAYVFVFGVLLLCMKGVLANYLTMSQIYAANAAGVMFVACFLVVNFVLDVAGIAELQSMLPRLRETTATYARLFKRGYAFSTEPGIVAFYINTLGPLALWYVWTRPGRSFALAVISTSLVAFGWVVTFSASGVAFLLLGMMFSAAIYALKFLHRGYSLQSIVRRLIVAIGSAGVAAFILSRDAVQQALYPMYLKLTLSDSLKTAVTRKDRWDAALDAIWSSGSLFGRGPGYTAAADEPSALNWYLSVLVEGGILAFAVLIAFMLVVLYRIVELRHPARFAILVGFVAGAGHLLVINTFFHPFLWLLIAIFYVQLARVRRYTGIESGSGVGDPLGNCRN